MDEKLDLLIWLQLHPGATASDLPGWYLWVGRPQDTGGPFFEIRAYHAPSRREETIRHDMLSPKHWGMTDEGILIAQRFLMERELVEVA